MKEFKGPRRQGGWAAVPYIIGAAGKLSKSNANRDANSQAAVNSKAEAMAALQQGYADEQTQRRQARQVLGEQAAALAEAGGSTGAEGLVRQSEANAEMDALNIRYGAQSKAAGLLSSSKEQRRAARSMQRNAPLLAGGELLQGYGAYRQQA